MSHVTARRVHNPFAGERGRGGGLGLGSSSGVVQRVNYNDYKYHQQHRHGRKGGFCCSPIGIGVIVLVIAVSAYSSMPSTKPKPLPYDLNVQKPTATTLREEVENKRPVPPTVPGQLSQPRNMKRKTTNSNPRDRLGVIISNSNDYQDKRTNGKLPFPKDNSMVFPARSKPLDDPFTFKEIPDPLLARKNPPTALQDRFVPRGPQSSSLFGPQEEQDKKNLPPLVKEMPESFLPKNPPTLDAYQDRFEPKGNPKSSSRFSPLEDQSNNNPESFVQEMPDPLVRNNRQSLDAYQDRFLPGGNPKSARLEFPETNTFQALVPGSQGSTLRDAWSENRQVNLPPSNAIGNNNNKSSWNDVKSAELIKVDTSSNTTHVISKHGTVLDRDSSNGVVVNKTSLATINNNISLLAGANETRTKSSSSQLAFANNTSAKLGPGDDDDDTQGDASDATLSSSPRNNNQNKRQDSSSPRTEPSSLQRFSGKANTTTTDDWFGTTRDNGRSFNSTIGEKGSHPTNRSEPTVPGSRRGQKTTTRDDDATDSNATLVEKTFSKTDKDSMRNRNHVQSSGDDMDEGPSSQTAWKGRTGQRGGNDQTTTTDSYWTKVTNSSQWKIDKDLSFNSSLKEGLFQSKDRNKTTVDDNRNDGSNPSFRTPRTKGSSPQNSTAQGPAFGLDNNKTATEMGTHASSLSRKDIKDDEDPILNATFQSPLGTNRSSRVFQSLVDDHNRTNSSLSWKSKWEDETENATTVVSASSEWMNLNSSAPGKEMNMSFTVNTKPTWANISRTSRPTTNKSIASREIVDTKADNNVTSSSRQSNDTRSRNMSSSATTTGRLNSTNSARKVRGENDSARKTVVQGTKKKSVRGVKRRTR